MLLEFKASNYKTFKDDLIFSMIPAPKQKGLDYSIFSEKIGKKHLKGLSSSVIYGPNASGKTNIIGAIDTFKSIIIKGNIRNEESATSPNVAKDKLELIPNNTLTSSKPVEFSIKFTTNTHLIEYAASFDLGEFLDNKYSRKVLSEVLNVNDENIFVRKEKIILGNIEKFKDFFPGPLLKNTDSAIAIAENNLNPDELFLSNGFRTIFSSKIVNEITDWLSTKLKVVYGANYIKTTPEFDENILVEDMTNQAAHIFGVDENSVAYVKNNHKTEPTLCSLFRKGDKAAVIPVEYFESYGTVRFINLLPLISQALVDGGTLIVDEFDASIHPMALMNIVNIFHNDEININHAQLIFNTHNPIFLNSNLFRRDEIKFVEKDYDTHSSTHYSLSDFGTNGKYGVRKNDDYMKNYFVDCYGAIRDIDFSSLLKHVVEMNRGEQ